MEHQIAKQLAWELEEAGYTATAACGDLAAFVRVTGSTGNTLVLELKDAKVDIRTDMYVHNMPPVNGIELSDPHSLDRVWGIIRLFTGTTRYRPLKPLPSV